MAGGRLTPHKNWFEGGRALELSGNLMWPISLIPRVRSPHFMVPHTPNVVAPPHDTVPLNLGYSGPFSITPVCYILRGWARHCAAWPPVLGKALCCLAPGGVQRGVVLGVRVCSKMVLVG